MKIQKVVIGEGRAPHLDLGGRRGSVCDLDSGGVVFLETKQAQICSFGHQLPAARAAKGESARMPDGAWLNPNPLGGKIDKATGWAVGTHCRHDCSSTFGKPLLVQR